MRITPLFTYPDNSPGTGWRGSIGGLNCDHHTRQSGNTSQLCFREYEPKYDEISHMHSATTHHMRSIRRISTTTCISLTTVEYQKCTSFGIPRQQPGDRVARWYRRFDLRPTHEKEWQLVRTLFSGVRTRTRRNVSHDFRDNKQFALTTSGASAAPRRPCAFR